MPIGKSLVLALCVASVAWADGAPGATGASGTPGASGNTGSSGASGTTGASGNSGSSGAPGTTGTSGTSGAPGTTGTSGTTGSSGATGAIVLQPKLSGIHPAAPLIMPNEPLTLTGSDFQNGLVVTLTDPQGNQSAAQVLSTDPKRLVIAATLGSAGAWKVSAHNPNGQESDSLTFPVANAPPFNGPGAIGFLLTGIGVAYMLWRLLSFMLGEVEKSRLAGQWSLGDALSEESSYQPQQIRQKSDVILFASTSRLIALVGLMGILGIVVGVGYSIMWNLYVYGTVPDLSEVRQFLYGSACLFAPYLANQISSAFTPSAKVKGGNAAGIAITGVAPAEPEVDAAAQSLHVIGSGFQTGLSLTVTDPSGTNQTVSGTDITAVSDTLVTANVTMNAAGIWNVSAANPGGTASGALTYTVFGPPTITGITAPLPAVLPAAQKVTFVGTGFISGLKVELTAPTPAGGGAAPAAVTVKADTVTSTSVVVQAAINVAGQWTAVITNPRDHASAAFNFTV